MNYEETLGCVPERVCQPTTFDGVQQAIAEATGPTVIWGGGVGQDHGHAPGSVQTLLDLSELNQILAVEPGDMTITVQAGVTLAQVQAALAPHGQWLPLDPPQAERATVGGVLATNAFGPLRLGYGTSRDWLVGIRVIDAGGKQVCGGGKVVKNVTGYDLPKLHIGALGTLGVIVEATFKTSPRPEATRMVLIPTTDLSALDGFLGPLFAQTSPVQALLHDDSAGKTLALVYHGPTEAADDEAGRAADLVVEAGLSASVYGEEFSAEPAGMPVAVRLSGLPSEALRLHARAREAAGEAAVLDTRLGVGIVTVYWPEDSDQARDGAKKLLAMGAAATLLHGPLALRSTLKSLWTPSPSALPLMKLLKTTLDPDNKLNPGRFLTG